MSMKFTVAYLEKYTKKQFVSHPWRQWTDRRNLDSLARQFIRIRIASIEQVSHLGDTNCPVVMFHYLADSRVFLLKLLLFGLFRLGVFNLAASPLGPAGVLSYEQAVYALEQADLTITAKNLYPVVITHNFAPYEVNPRPSVRFWLSILEKSGTTTLPCQTISAIPTRHPHLPQ